MMLKYSAALHSSLAGILTWRLRVHRVPESTPSPSQVSESLVSGLFSKVKIDLSTPQLFAKFLCVPTRYHSCETLND